MLCLVVIGGMLYLPLARTNTTWQTKYSFVQKNVDLRELSQAPPNIAMRLFYWKYYSKEISTNARVFLLGHAEHPDRSKIPSAHNYYLDFIYNFGLLPLIPLLAVIGYTLGMIYRNRKVVLNSPGLLGMAMVVIFMLLGENSLKVGLRQPYPGILTFFLWGVLLSRLARLEAPGLEAAAALPATAAVDED